MPDPRFQLIPPSPPKPANDSLLRMAMNQGVRPHPVTATYPSGYMPAPLPPRTQPLNRAVEAHGLVDLISPENRTLLERAETPYERLGIVGNMGMGLVANLMGFPDKPQFHTQDMGLLAKQYGQPRFETVEDKQAVIPLSGWNRAGVEISAEAPLPNTGGAYFLTHDGKWVDVTDTTHWDTLAKATNTSWYKLKDYKERLDWFHNLLNKHKLIRIGHLNDYDMSMEMNSIPTYAQIEAISNVMKERPDMSGAYIEKGKALRDWDIGQTKVSPRRMLQALSSFYYH